eukprot:Rhum_TRINITY_DN10307_c1_g1::Rhum_TRINITY_DN10307_c1_g1_i1::g.37852::m.37852
MSLFGTGETPEETARLDAQIPRNLHINHALKRHPWHPFDPERREGDACYDYNTAFAACMYSMGDEMPLHMKHVNCYGEKSALMKCVVRSNKLARQQAEQELQQQAGTQQ